MDHSVHVSFSFIEFQIGGSWAQKPVFKGLFFWLYVIKYFLLQWK